MISKDKLQEKPSIVTEAYTFGDVVDKACDDLMDCQIKFSIRRIREMEERLCSLEQELNAFLLQKNGKQ